MGTTSKHDPEPSKAKARAKAMRSSIITCLPAWKEKILRKLNVYSDSEIAI